MQALEDILNKLIIESDPSIRKYSRPQALHNDPEDHPDVIMLVSTVIQIYAVLFSVFV